MKETLDRQKLAKGVDSPACNTRFPIFETGPDESPRFRFLLVRRLPATTSASRITRVPATTLPAPTLYAPTAHCCHTPSSSSSAPLLFCPCARTGDALRCVVQLRTFPPLALIPIPGVHFVPGFSVAHSNKSKYVSLGGTSGLAKNRLSKARDTFSPFSCRVSVLRTQIKASMYP